MKLGDVVTADWDGKRYSLVVTGIKDYPESAGFPKLHPLTIDEMPPYDHGARFYRGNNPCCKCSKFPSCFESGKSGNHDDCFVERNA